MHFYHMNFDAVMLLPMKTFWLMNNNIDRIQARADMRSLVVGQMSQATPEGVAQLRSALVIEAGVIVKMESDNPLKASMDQEGFADLKKMAQQSIGSNATI